MSEMHATATHLRDDTIDVEMQGHHVMVGDGRGPSAVDMALGGLAACTAIDVASILRKSRQPVTGLVVRADAERAIDHPRRITRVLLTYEVSGVGIDRRAVERAVRLSEEKYCSVSATFKLPAEIDTRILLEDPGEGGNGDRASDGGS